MGKPGNHVIESWEGELWNKFALVCRTCQKPDMTGIYIGVDRHGDFEGAEVSCRRCRVGVEYR